MIPLVSDTSHSFLWGWLIIIAILATAGAYYYLRQKPKPKPVPSPIITSADFGSIIPHLSGHIGSLNSIAGGVTDDMAVEVFTAVRLAVKYHGSEAAKKWFDDFFENFQNWDNSVYTKKASLLMNRLRDAGLNPDNDKPFVWSSEFASRYRQFNTINVGQPCKVLAEAWLYNGNVVERGMVQGI